MLSNVLTVDTISEASSVSTAVTTINPTRIMNEIVFFYPNPRAMQQEITRKPKPIYMERQRNSAQGNFLQRL